MNTFWEWLWSPWSTRLADWTLGTIVAIPAELLFVLVVVACIAALLRLLGWVLEAFLLNVKHRRWANVISTPAILSLLSANAYFADETWKVWGWSASIVAALIWLTDESDEDQKSFERENKS